MTTRKCKLPRNEHRRDVINSKSETSALALHVENTKHVIDFDSFKIIDQENTKKKREFSEILHIYYHNNTLNRIEDTKKLLHIYKHTLDTLKNNEKTLKYPPIR